MNRYFVLNYKTTSSSKMCLTYFAFFERKYITLENAITNLLYENALKHSITNQLGTREVLEHDKFFGFKMSLSMV